MLFQAEEKQRWQKHFVDWIHLVLYGDESLGRHKAFPEQMGDDSVAVEMQELRDNLLCAWRRGLVVGLRDSLVHSGKKGPFLTRWCVQHWYPRFFYKGGRCQGVVRVEGCRSGEGRN